MTHLATVGLKASSSPRRLGYVSAAIVMCLAGMSIAAESDKAAAKAHYETATRLYDVHDYARAVEEYKAAYLAKPDPAFLFNMGQCYRKMGQADQALRFFRDYLKKAPHDDPNRAIVEARVRDIEAGTDPDLSTQQPSAAAALQPEVATPVLPVESVAPSRQASGLDLTSPAVPAEPATAAPFYKTWWFWTGVGAIVVAGGATAFALSNHGSTRLSADSALGTRAVFQ